MTLPTLRTIEALSIAFVTLGALVFSQPSGGWSDPSPHTARFVPVEGNVSLEVLDWGGSGRPLVLLAGGGDTAHVFDDFAPKLTIDHRVYGVTRRGFGASGFSAPPNAIDRLRDDVMAVIGALKIERPVLVGHSIAGAELSAVAASHADKVAALIYLEAGYPYAFDNGTGAAMKEFEISGPRAPAPTESDLNSFSALQEWDAELFGFPRPEAELRLTWESDSAGRPRKRRDSPGSPLFSAIMASTNKFTRIPVPALIIFAIPNLPENWIRKSSDPQVRETAGAYFAAIDAAKERQAAAIERAVPTARVVRIRGAHYIFLSNEADTLREMHAFLNGLK